VIFTGCLECDKSASLQVSCSLSFESTKGNADNEGRTVNVEEKKGNADKEEITVNDEEKKDNADNEGITVNDEEIKELNEVMEQKMVRNFFVSLFLLNIRDFFIVCNYC